VVYGNALSGPFVFDDTGAIVENRHLRQLWPPGVPLSAPPQVAVAGRPLVSLSLALNYAAGGLDVFGYHVVNVSLHLACALLLYGIVLRTLRGPPLAARFAGSSVGVALSCALIWLVHPLCTETVNYVVQRTESMMALFYLLTLYCAIRAWDGQAVRAWSVAAVAACTAGMLSKESMVTAPVAILLYDLAYRPAGLRSLVKRRRALYTGLLATWVVLAAILWTGPRSDTVGFSLGIGAVDYAKHQCVLVLDYLRTAFWPNPLVFDFGYARPFPPGIVGPYAALLAALLAATGVAYRRRPAAGFPAVWIFLLLAPTSSIVPIVSEVGAERRMYLPLAGLVVLCVVLGFRVVSRASVPWIRAAAAVLVVALAATLAWATTRRNLDYRSEETLWRTALTARPANPRAHASLGQAIHRTGRPAEAIPHYRRALDLDDQYSDAYFNLGVAEADLGRSDLAIENYRRALRLNPKLDRAQHNLGAELANRGDLEAAIGYFREALRLRPDWASAHRNLGRALRLTGRVESALQHLREAARLDPRCAVCYSDMAWILATHPQASVRDPRRAVGLAERAVELGGNAEGIALDTLAAAYANAGRFDEAVVTARRALDAVELRDDTARRLQLYLRGEPYREP